MTNAIVWMLPKLGQTWAASDSRITIDKKSIVTDKAPKILPLNIRVRRDTMDHKLETEGSSIVGFCYAGAVTPALMTYTTADFFLSNLIQGPGSTNLPTGEKIAELVRILSGDYIRSATLAYGSPPICEFALFGRTIDVEGGACHWAYHIHPGGTVNGEFQQAVTKVDIAAGDILILGQAREELLADIKDLQARRRLDWDGVEPRIALRRRLLKQNHGAVGGGLQGAILDENGFERFSSLYDEDGRLVQNWAGVNYQRDASTAIGMEIRVTGLLG